MNRKEQNISLKYSTRSKFYVMYRFRRLVLKKIFLELKVGLYSLKRVQGTLHIQKNLGMYVILKNNFIPSA
jgi:hypothetical protein